jgi:hypothetical protein
MGQLTVHYERKFGDGNFGSEGLSLSLEVDVPDQELVSEYVEDRAGWLRSMVLTELARSAAERVRWAANHELKAREPKPALALDGEETSVEDLPF